MFEKPDRDLALTRRLFLVRGAAGLSASWVGLHWPAIVRAAEHARHSANSQVPPKFEFFTAEEAREVDSITSRIIPKDDTAGAREAGVVYFIDRALVTFAKGDQEVYRGGLTGIQARVTEMYPEVGSFSAANSEQQDAVLKSIDGSPPSGPRRLQTSGKAPQFFEILRQHTILGFLIDPDSGREGNRDAAGWIAIGREPGHTFQPPFGFYDKNYPGWQPNPVTAEKK